ncbi:folylpolyglutamate synthase/dihydrofolate synthase family protein [Bacillus sp. B15-48]|uniref:bifunctional folylpolyglutamate synthase/dihydrofolate synthase n=1 Tax=Bacillus sp. B15-48 TaxID=1548601 RepID=UPI00193F4F05|nr:folylpolyglutamate synthase/dihydrofolate synthase family protein [Bacillus sp. B15-48]MBM4762454.1 bifunctional folylpolyglutamate synthase/dihydrofolate synthase [Bacillus sp. B15-48]
MITTYNEALDWIHARLRLGIKPGLKRMEWMMNKLGSPHLKVKAVHIGGTNGKGSTVTFLRSILEAGGYTIGTFTSPYIETFNERISVNGEPLNDDDLIHLVNKIKPLADELAETDLGGPTEFEVITAMAFYYFGEIRSVDLVLFEVGLGGRFDSTNIIEPIAAIITNIGLDHTNILGNTYEEIAFEKAGIIKPLTPVFTAVQQQEALKVIEEQANKKQAPLNRLQCEFSIVAHQSAPKGEKFTLIAENDEWRDLELSMIGKHQTENAALAVITARYLHEQKIVSIDYEAIRSGLKCAYWPGRFEILSEQPFVIIDGAHNEEGIERLCAELKNRYADKSIHIVFAALRDKKLTTMIAKLDEVAEQITFVSFDFPRAATAEELVKMSSSKHKLAVDDWFAYFSEEIERKTENDVFVITGSLYFISAAKPYLHKMLNRNKVSIKP